MLLFLPMENSPLETDCLNVGPPWATVHARKPAAVWAPPHKTQFLPGAWLCMGSPPAAARGAL